MYPERALASASNNDGRDVQGAERGCEHSSTGGCFNVLDEAHRVARTRLDIIELRDASRRHMV